MIRHDVDGDRRERASAHPDDLEPDEVGDGFDEPSVLEPATVYTDKAEFLGQALHDLLRRRVVRAQEHGHAVPGDLLTVELDAPSGKGIERLHDARARHVRLKPLGDRGHWRGEVKAGTLVWVGDVEPSNRTVVAIDHDPSRERRRPQKRRRQDITYRVEHHVAELGSGGVVADPSRARTGRRDGRHPPRVSRAEQHRMAGLYPARCKSATHVAGADDADSHVRSSTLVFHCARPPPYSLLSGAQVPTVLLGTIEGGSCRCGARSISARSRPRSM